MLRLTGVEVNLPGFRLEDISFHVDCGKCMVIVGPSGSGKSVLLNTIAGVYKVRKGKISLNGRDITSLLPEKRGIGYIPQNLALFPHLSVRDNILFGARAMRIPHLKARERLQELASLLKIEHLLERRSPLGLSGGEKQRVALARTLLVGPAIILMDEPFSALDGFIRRKLILYLKEVFSTLKTTVVHVTHDLQEAFLLADAIGVMIGGRMPQIGPREEVCYRPATLGVAQIFSGSNLFRGRIVGCRPQIAWCAETEKGLFCELPWNEGLKIGQPVIFGINPREVMLIREGRPLNPRVQTNIFSARIKNIFDNYGSYLIFLVLEGREEVELEIPGYVFRDMSIGVHSTVAVSLKKDCLWVLPQ